MSIKEFIMLNWKQKAFWAVFGIGAAVGAGVIIILAIAIGVNV
jgi:hypothetical protein